MWNYNYLLLILLVECLIIVNCTANIRKFPSDFQWGVGSSSYQIEGGWGRHGKGESIWDHMLHQYPEKIVDHSNADITADSYHHWHRDVEMVRELGVNIYRFSISWPRILPTGFVNHINKHGLHYYNRLINELLRHNIEPMITMYHWDLPQRIQELGGWTNPEIINYFQDYAEILFEHFGDRVKLWTTINEPWHICYHSYDVDFMAPAMNFPGIPTYLCGHNVLKAHAEVVHLYRNKFQHAQKGSIGITTDISWPEPKSEHQDDRIASELALQFNLGWFAHPIFSKTGNYPKIMIERIAALSNEQGFTRSRLPEFTEGEINRIRGTSDFFGINSYTSVLVTRNDRNNTVGYPIPGFYHDMGIIEEIDRKWKGSGSIWLHHVPKGMYNLLMWINKEYDNPMVIVTENGVSDKGGVNDWDRIEYFNSYLEAILDAVEDGCKVKGFIAWSLMDSFEWKAGYTEKFGLYHVDFSSPNRTRTQKLSAKNYANIIKTRHIDWALDLKPIHLNATKSHQFSNINNNSRQLFNNFSIILIILLSNFLNYILI